MKRNSIYEHYKGLAEVYICEMASKLTSPSKKLIEAIEYSLLSGGKRLRPAIFLAAFDACRHFDIAKTNEPNDESIKKHLCFAIEALHTYTLIHDDLPCMDNDTMRRGKPSNHVVFGEAHALLAGDALLNLAIEHALSAVCEQKHIEAVKYFFKHTGIRGVIGGQSIEFEMPESDIKANGVVDIERDLQIMEHKTAALFKAAAVMGGIVGTPCDMSENKNISLLEQFGYNFGMAFQIHDDIKDCDKPGFAKKYGAVRADIFLREYIIKARLAAEELNSELLILLANNLIEYNM